MPTTELEDWKAKTRTAFEQAQAKDKVSATNNLLTGDTMSKLIEAAKTMLSKTEESLKLEEPLAGILLELGKLSFFIRLFVVEPLQALDFVAVRTQGGGRDPKDAAVGVFEDIAHLLDVTADGIKTEIEDRTPSAKIYSYHRRGGSQGMWLSGVEKGLSLLGKLYEEGTFNVEWGTPQ